MSLEILEITLKINEMIEEIKHTNTILNAILNEMPHNFEMKEMFSEIKKISKSLDVQKTGQD